MMDFGTPVLEPGSANGVKQVPQFNPYQDNGGTVASIAGDDYVIVAADTRFTLGYSIPTRKISRVLKINDKVMLGTAGMQADMCALHKVMSTRMRMYEHDNNKPMTFNAVSQMLSTVLYYKRFFPYYTFNIVAGLDDKGEGWVCGYDAIGSFEQRKIVCNGAGTKLMQPVFDNQVDWAQSWDGAGKPNLSLEQATDLMKDAFTSAAEREITVGDTLQIYKITKDGIELEEFELKKD
uniref:Proteasome subunit beta n=1 Tax=Rhodosorus marinus TaxID=101924 RepID=A0A7S0BK59_9RHOD|mmetsp:Transcript_18848/g.27247  ORF Transcript_18848/g.27247 Transcript_18848/m.27247 type:complete len:236 (+) Transcript_18848:105-812(+)